MDEQLIVSRIVKIDFNNFKNSGLTIYVADLFDGYRKIDDQKEKVPVDYFYFSLEHFLFICCCWNKNFFLYMLRRKEIPDSQALLCRLCDGAEITFRRTEKSDGPNKDWGYVTKIEKIILQKSDIQLQKIKQELKENYNFAHSEEPATDKDVRNAILERNEVRCLYHFTDRRNIESIRSRGGLYSWFYCEMHDIDIPLEGGNDSSRANDVRHGLQDYVRLSFCRNHPMCGRLEEDGHDLVLLRVSPEVALWEKTLFSDMNATDGGHQHGGGTEMLSQINFAATKRERVTKDDPDFKYRQAEVMVKTHIPLKYILNIDEIQ